MASFYNRRASYVASWAPQRIYPRQEPSFDGPTSPSQVAPAATLIRTNSTCLPNSQPELAVSENPTPAVTRPIEAPPPIYYPGANRPRVTAGDLPVGTVRSTNTATSKTAKLEWEFHPTFTSGWRRVVRPYLWWNVFTDNKEEICSEWPKEFGGPGKRNFSASNEESGGVSRWTSRRSGVSTLGADSGVALTPRATIEAQHVCEPIFKQRVSELNELICANLPKTRKILATLEILNTFWFIVLIIALGVDGGQHGRFLDGVALSLILIIVLNGIGVTKIRVARWNLSRELRNRTRDWSPLPMTSSTNYGLLNNAQLQGLGEEENHQEIFTAQRRKEGEPTLRWRMRQTEGTVWLSYRPIIKVELVTPAQSEPIYSLPPQSEPIPPIPAHDAPAYTES